MSTRDARPDELPNGSRTGLPPTPTAAPSDLRPLLLSVDEAGLRLGVGRSLLYKLLTRGEITSVHVGRLRRIRPTDLDAYVERLST